MKNIELKLYNITKEFEIAPTKIQQVKVLLGINKEKKKFAALRGVSLEAKQGQILGVIGLNGSGKSTLLNIIAEVLPPSTGLKRVIGKVSLLSVSSGLRPNLTGIQNINYKLLMEGISPKQIKKQIDNIIKFAELGEHINMELKTYSAGMKAKLGFAISIHTNPDILIIDESLAVGDATFLNKCTDKIKELKEAGKIIIFVSHASGQVKNMCDEVIWLHYGKLVGVGKPEKVIDKYEKFISDFKKLSKEDQEKYKYYKKEEQFNFDLKKYNFDLVAKMDHLALKDKKIAYKNLTNPILKNKRIISEVIFLIIGIILILIGLYLLENGIGV